MMKRRILYILLIIAFLGDLLCVYFDFNDKRFFTKTLLIPLLISIYYFEAQSQKLKIENLFLTGLLFSFFGDLFLIFGWGFIPGLASFLVAHLFYIISFSKFSKHRVGLKYLILLMSYLILFIAFLFPYLGEMKIPVFVYATIISLMLYFSIKTDEKLLILGALIFVVSDSLLSINMFVQQSKVLSLLVMITYVIAQFLLIKGVLSISKKSSLQRNY